MPELPERKSKGDQYKTERPYTAMAVNGLAAGLSWADMRTMKYTHLVQLLWEWDNLHGAESEEVRDATPADVMALARL